MKNRNPKEAEPLKYLAVFLLVVIVFSSGVLLGNHLTSKKLDTLTDMEQKIRLETQSAEVQYQILVANPCQFVNSTPLTEDLYKLSERLDFLETLFGEDDENVLRLKEQYSLLEVRHWLYVEKTNKECGTRHTPVIYFYSNTGDCPDCEEQGFVLTYLRKKYPDLRVYSFDINLENTAVETIKDIYEVESTPTVILESIVYPRFVSRSELEEALEARDLI